MKSLSLSSVAVLAVFLLAVAGLSSLASGQTITTAPAGSYEREEQTAPAKRITLRDAAILGVVEGLTEYLPVSSTGHLILTGRWLGLNEGSELKSQAVDSFEVAIQLGAILAVLGLYRQRVKQMMLGLAGIDKQGLALATKLFIAFLPAAIIGLLLRHPIKEHLFKPLPVVWALAVGGVLMIVAERVWRQDPRPKTASIDALTYRQALFIGLAQVLAMWPGTSRSMITIVAALLVGMEMLPAAEFSFLLALPTLGAATIYEGYKGRNELLQYVGKDGVLIGLFVSFIVALIAVKAFVKWLTKHGLTPFGIYRIILAAAVYWFIAHGQFGK